MGHIGVHNLTKGIRIRKISTELILVQQMNNNMSWNKTQYAISLKRPLRRSFILLCERDSK